MEKIVEKIDIVHEWFYEVFQGEYAVSNGQAYELIEKLEEVNGRREMAETQLEMIMKRQDKFGKRVDPNYQTIKEQMEEEDEE